MDVKVVDYQDSWTEEYNLEKNSLQLRLQEQLIRCFHIGSTSIKGLRAKPVIDLLLIVKDLEYLDRLSQQMKIDGYEVMGEFGIRGRRYFRKGGAERTHHIHAFKFDNITEIVRHIAFRDYLQENKERRQQYSALKSHLASQYPYDIKRYIDGKNALIKDIEREALIWYWLDR
ncbi:GrpB family protein [Kurthia sibirica]|uniref:GrpB family protein n=1 Tax=Kurthia sibirica TaxID=202750 RepID=A0A2U3AP24_9BACL|nr:GrpB family protein [Kurthia sibirica]PWI26303.1 hypothetical protein DEX24_02920 [Kurthia sibirica]GEK35028.1 hypothetical protein KSI01_25610 [Kurthia sibirica]